jgi:hypothetical protein
MKNKTVVKIVALSALLVLVGILAGCLMDVPPSALAGKWGTIVLTVPVFKFEFKEGEIRGVAGIKLYDAKYSGSSITTYNTVNGNEIGTAKYSIKKDKLTIEENDAGLAKGTYIRMD